MDTRIYYDRKNQGLLITCDFEEIQKWMDLEVDPMVEYKRIKTSEINNYKIKDVGFDKVQDEAFQSIKDVLFGLKLEVVAFHESTVDLSDIVIDVQHLLIGEKSKINLSSKNFINLNEITFLSIKSFKGKVLDQFDTVEKAIFWDSTKNISLAEMFPNIKELTVNKGNLIELDLRNNKKLEMLDVHYCTKLEKILLPDKHILNDIFIENCKNLDVSNLPSSVTRVWPAKKENLEKKFSNVNIKSTGNKHIDSLFSDLKKNMEEYMHENNPSYTQNDINQCIKAIFNCVIKIFEAVSKDDAREFVKSTVLKLNKLNEECDYSLIETHEREQIVEIIILAGHEKNYNAVDEDITEEWREW